jgi:hypothetical protein
MNAFETYVPNLGAAYAEGQAAGNQNALRRAVQQYGPAAMAGDQNALRELAKYDPELSMGLTSSQQQMDLRGAADARDERNTGSMIDDRAARLELAREEARQATEEHAADMSAKEREAALGKVQAVGAFRDVETPEEWDYRATTLKLDDLVGGFDERDELFATLDGVQAALAPKEEDTADMRNLKFRAEQAGLQPGTPEYSNFMANGGVPRGMSLSVGPDGTVNFSDGVPGGTAGLIPKAPTGFVNTPNDDGTVELAPIEGGPGTQMPAELAARIAVADDGLKQLPAIIERAANGDLTGVMDWAWGTIGRGQQGADRRDIAGASEAITRLLTGAGMNNTEIAKEGWMYTPALTDDAPTVVSKLTRLYEKLQSAKDVALKGRGGAVAVDPSTGMGVPGQSAAPKRLRFNPETGELE